MDKWQNPEVIALWIGSFLLVVLLLALFIILLVRVAFRRLIETKLEEAELILQHRETLLETSILVQEQERKRIAADIHDELIGKLVAVQLSMNSHIPSEDVNRMFSDCIAGARKISHDLVPPMIESVSLNELIADLVEPFKDVFRCQVYVVHEQELPATVKIQCMRLLRECLVNTRKHAAATRVAIQVKTSHETLFVRFSDNGSGFITGRIVPGLGLKNIETRMHYLKGKYKLKTGEGKGTSYLFAIPLKS